MENPLIKILEQAGKTEQENMVKIDRILNKRNARMLQEKKKHETALKTITEEINRLRALDEEAKASDSKKTK